MWAKLDDSFPEHPKVVSLSDAAFRMHVEAICYSARNLTDGRLPAGYCRRLRTRPIGELLMAGLWHQDDDGFRIHDFLDWNPSRERVLDEREKAKRRRNVGQTSGDDPPSVGKRSDAPSLTLTRGSSASPQNPKPPASPNGSARKDEMFEAVVVVCAWDLQHLTRDARGRANSAAKELREVGARPSLVLGFGELWKRHYPRATLTPQAITGNWPDYMAGKLFEGAR